MRRATILTPMFVFAFATPAFAQQTTTTDQTTRDQVAAIVMKYVSAFNTGDTQAYSDLFAPNAVDINPFGMHKKTGAQFSEALDVTRKLGLTLTAKVDDVEPLFGGQEALAIASYTGNYRTTRSRRTYAVLCCSCWSG